LAIVKQPLKITLVVELSLVLVIIGFRISKKMLQVLSLLVSNKSSICRSEGNRKISIYELT